MSGHRWSAMKFQNVLGIQLMILDPGFYIFIMEKLSKLKKNTAQISSVILYFLETPNFEVTSCALVGIRQ